MPFVLWAAWTIGLLVSTVLIRNDEWRGLVRSAALTNLAVITITLIGVGFAGVVGA